MSEQSNFRRAKKRKFSARLKKNIYPAHPEREAVEGLCGRNFPTSLGLSLNLFLAGTQYNWFEIFW